MGAPSSLGYHTRLPQVMVSYSSHDLDRVMEFVRALRAAGVAVWIDQGGIDGAQRWSEEIVNAIEGCRVVLLFISRPSMESANIGKEVALAWESGKQFLPVALEEAKIPKSMQYQLAGIQYVKYYEGDPQAKFEAVLRALIRLEVHVSPYSMALVSAGLGEREQALEWLSKACDERVAGLSRLASEPRFQSLRSEPRFVEISRRVESLTLQTDDVTSEVVLSQPLTQVPQVPTGPQPWWKDWLWPDIFDDRTARAAAAQGVWASAVIIALSWLFSLLVPNTWNAYTWWNDPIFRTVTFAAVGFGVQKMGRPAAVIGTVLCGLGALGNLSLISMFRAAMAAQPNEPNYSSIYYSAWFGLVAGLVFVSAFANAWRGTFAYRALVQARQAKDKQDALVPQDLLAARRRAETLFQKMVVFAKTLKAHLPMPVLPTSGATAQVPPLATREPGLKPERSTPVEPAGSLTESEVMQEVGTVEELTPAESFGDLIGANPVQWKRAAVFFAANLASNFVFMLARAIGLPGPLHPVYWQLAFLRGAAVTLAAWLAFRFLRQGWMASLAGGALATLLMLPVYNTLATFDYSDLLYREQFQQFLLVPFVEVTTLLLGLFYLVPRIRPLGLGLWLGAVCSEVAAGMVLKVLSEFGSGTLPDPVLAGIVAGIVGLRSVVFAGVFWGGSKLAAMQRT